MFIKLIAKDLYRLTQEVEELEKALREACPAKRGELEDRLRKARAERKRMRDVLEGSKATPPYRKPR
jgi:hypothetical protein